MRFVPTAVDGAFVIELAVHRDDRGAFARTFCEDAFSEAGIDFRVIQTNISRNPREHTLRGLHLNAPPHEEPKIVQCVRGRVFDVAVDLRPTSPTYLASAWTELDSRGERLFYIPPGCAHGFLTLEPDSDVLYQMGKAYVPGFELGARWNDPAFAIPWPAAPAVISDRDAAYPLIGTGRRLEGV